MYDWKQAGSTHKTNMDLVRQHIVGAGQNKAGKVFRQQLLVALGSLPQILPIEQPRLFGADTLQVPSLRRLHAYNTQPTPCIPRKHLLQMLTQDLGF